MFIAAVILSISTVTPSQGFVPESKTSPAPEAVSNSETSDTSAYQVHPNVQQVRDAMAKSAALFAHVQSISKCTTPKSHSPVDKADESV